MAKSILKGITVEIDGDAADLIAALDSAERAAKRLGRTAEETRKALVLKWDGGDFEKAQATAQGAVDRTEGSVRALRQALENLDAAGGGRRAQRQLDELHAQLDKAQRKAAEARARLQEIDGVRLDHIAKQADALGNALIKAGAGLTQSLSTPLKLAADKAVEAAGDLAVSQGVIETAFGDAAAQVNAWAKTLMEDFGLSQLTAGQYAGQFMTLANAMGVSRDAGAEMSMALTGLSADMASFYSVRQDVAADALKAVFTGESESLAQFGVVLQEANLSAYALSQGMQTAYAEMSQAEQVMLRYQFVTEALSLTQGDFARNSGSLANQQRLLQEQCRELAIEWGMELLPIARDVITWINGMVRSFSGLTDGQKSAVLTIAACAAALGPLLTAVGGLTQAAETAIRIWQAFTTAQAAAAAAVAVGDSGVKAFTASLMANTAAQAAATAGIALVVAALIGLTAYVVNSDNELTRFSQSIEDSQRKLDSWENSLEDLQAHGLSGSAARMSELTQCADELLPRIEELANKTHRTKEETAELQGLIPYLNEQLGYEAVTFDAATGQVNANTNAIYDNIEALKKRALFQAAQKKVSELTEQLGEMQLQERELEKNIAGIEPLEYKFGDWKNNLKKSLGVDSERLKAWGKQLEENRKLQADFEGQIEELQNGILIPGYAEGLNGQQAGSDAIAANPIGVDGMTREQREEAFRRDQDELQRMRAIGVIDLAEYRKNMNRLNVLYNTDSAEAYKENYARINGTVFSGEKQMTEAVRSGGSARAAAARSALDGQTAEVKKAYDAQVQAVRDAYAQQKQAAQEAHDAQMAAIDEELAAREAAIDAQIRAIDEEIEARRRQKQEEDYDGQIASIQASIDYGAGKFDEFTLRELRAQLAAVEAERADYRWNLEQEDRKAALQAQLEDARAVAGQQKAALQEMYDAQLAAMEEEYQLHLEQLDAVFKTADGAFREISAEFAAAMQAGAESAAAALRAAIGSAYSAAAAQERTRAAGSVSTTDARTYSPSVTLNNSGYSERQVARIVEQMTYE